MKNQRIAVTGMGRSGISIANAIQKRGGQAVVYDEKSAETPERIAAVESLEGNGIEVVTGWHGHLVDEKFDILVTSPGFRREHPAIRDALKNGKEVISEVEFAYRISPAPIVAITGTNGKSTTTVLTHLFLQAAGGKPVLCGNIAGSGYTELTLTEAADQATADQILVAEISSYQLEWVHDFRPKVATITNITPDHLDRHPTFEDYFNTKLRIFAKQAEGDIAVVNLAEPTVSLAQAENAIPTAATIRTFDPRAATPYLDQALAENLALRGEHNRVNALQALACAEAALTDTLNSEQIKGAIQAFHALDHRLEILGQKNGITIVNNSMCTNPGAVIASSRAVGGAQTLLMGGVDKNLPFESVGEYLKASKTKAVVFGPNHSDFNKKIGGNWPSFESLEEAFEYAARDARAPHTIMLAPGCASAWPYENFKERGEAFRAIAKEWLKS